MRDFGPFFWPNYRANQKVLVIWLWGNGLNYNISKDQCSRIRTVASGLKKVHFWNPICKASLAWWDGPSPWALSYINRSRKNLLEFRPKNKLRVAFVGFGSYYADIYWFTSYFVLLDSYLNNNQIKFCLYAKISLIIKFLTWFKCFLSVEFESNCLAPTSSKKWEATHAF